MNQEDLMKLLTESAEAYKNNNVKVVMQNQVKLTDALGKVKRNSKKEGIEAVIEALYVTTLENNTDHLVELFPFFAMVCCNDDERVILTKDINWSLLNK